LTRNTANSAGFNTLYQEHHEWLVRWIARRTYSTDTDSAQDLAQDTFIRLLNKTSLYSEIRSPRAWLTKVAGNLVTDDIHTAQDFRKELCRFFRKHARNSLFLTGRAISVIEAIRTNRPVIKWFKAN